MEERTLIIFKPDAVQRHLLGRLLRRFEEKGLKLVAAKLMRIPEDLARKHYAIHKDQAFYEPAVKFLSSSPALLMVWQADRVISITRKLMGATFGFEAQPGTIRGDFGCSGRYNLVHGSDSPETAEFEIELYFKPEEIIDYSLSDEDWLYS